MAALLAVSLCAGSAVSSGAKPRQKPRPTAARIDRLFAQWQKAGSPGCSVAVSRGGATVFEKGYGTANIEHGIAITPASVFHVASVTKPFTAMSVLLLARDGTLGLDDDVRRYFPGWQTPSVVTIRHLLTHTSGVRDPFLLTELAVPHDGGPSLQAHLVDLLTRQRGLSETPGTRYVYNNGGYMLLADIVRRSSGQSLRAFADARIFRPLGMRRTHMHDDRAEIVPNLATGYTRDDNGALRVAPLPGGVVGNAGLFTTAGDLLRWARNFATPVVGDRALLDAMTAVPTLPGGEQTSYALGLQVEQTGGRRAFGHAGGDPGASAEIVRYPDANLAVAVLCNIDGVDATGLARAVADEYLGALPTPAAVPTAAAAVSTAALAGNEGLYRSPKDESLLRIFVRDGQLRGSAGAGTDGGWPVTPLGDDRFAIATTPIVLEFSAAADGGRMLRIVGERPTPAILYRVQPYAPDLAALLPLTGDFESNELSTTWSLWIDREHRLSIQIPGRAPITLQPIEPDLYAGPLVGSIKFERDAVRDVNSFTIYPYGARGVHFDRAPPAPAR